MKITIWGETYDYKFDSMLVAESKTLKKSFGFPGVAPWSEAIENGDGEAIAALLYFAKKRAGEVVKPNDFDNLPFIRDVKLEPDEDESESQDDDSVSKENPT